MIAKRLCPTTGSRICPRMYRENMLVSRWNRPAWRKPAVTSRQYSPWAMASRYTAPSVRRRLSPIPPEAALAPPKTEPSATTTLMAMST